MLTVLALIGFVLWVLVMVALVLAVPVLMLFDGLFGRGTDER